MYPMCFIIRPHAFISMFKTIISKCSTQLFRIKKKIKKKKKKKKKTLSIVNKNLIISKLVEVD